MKKMKRLYFDDPNWSTIQNTELPAEGTLFSESLRAATKWIAIVGLLVSLCVGGVRLYGFAKWAMTPVYCKLSLDEYHKEFRAGRSHHGEWVKWRVKSVNDNGSHLDSFAARRPDGGIFLVEPKQPMRVPGRDFCYVVEGKLRKLSEQFYSVEKASVSLGWPVPDGKAVDEHGRIEKAKMLDSLDTAD